MGDPQPSSLTGCAEGEGSETKCPSKDENSQATGGCNGVHHVPMEHGEDIVRPDLT